jgi:hypothetical protein
VDETHQTAPIIINMRKPVEAEVASTDKESYSSTEVSSDGDPQELEECWDLGTEYEEDSSAEYSELSVPERVTRGGEEQVRLMVSKSSKRE